MNYYCPNCKNLVKEGSKYCVECGYILEKPDPNPSGSINLLKIHSIKKEAPKQTIREEELLKNIKNHEEKKSLEDNEILNNNESLKKNVRSIQPGYSGDDYEKNDSNADIEFHVDAKDSEKKQFGISISDIVLRLGIISILILLLSFIWWIYMHNGSFTSSKDLNLLIIFCIPGSIFGITAIVLGEIDLSKTCSSKSKNIYLRKSVNGILLGAMSVGIVLTLIFIRWISF